MTITSTLTRTEGHLRLRAERVGARTRITEMECRAPLQLMRCHYLDAAQPDMAFATVVSPSGGVLQGDRLELQVTVAEGARLHLDTASAMRLYRMPDQRAEQEVTLTVAEDGFLEYLPDPAIPFAGADFVGRTDARVAEGATLILTEAVTAGRAARGEVHQFKRYESVVEIGRPGGRVLSLDATILDPADGLAALGRLGGQAATGTLYVVGAGFGAATLRAAAADANVPDTVAGASTLPGGLGAWLKVLGPDGPSVSAVLTAAAAAAHEAILGTPAPGSRRP
ncbi:MAG: urease accessory protein UreD [Chloroflexota bacterium]